jgi:uncharacterized protein (TIGR02217 family)
MSFIDQRLPDEIERGAQGGPGFKTVIAETANGYEQRNITWSQSKAAYDVGYGIMAKDGTVHDVNVATVLSFFNVCKGRGHSFRFKDWSDYEIGKDSTDTYQAIAIADGAETEFQIVKRYTVDSNTHERIITKPVDGTLRVFLGASEQTEDTDYTVDYATGVITFLSAPTAALSVNVICEFDVPVRFDIDKLDVVVHTWRAGSVPNIPLVEVRGE